MTFYDGRQDDRTELRRRMVIRRQIYHALFFLGTLLAVVGWYVDIKDIAELNPTIGRLSLLALIGHALQVTAAFFLLLLPDEMEDDEGSNDE